jgi:sugar lactone lactonase YvrE
MNPGQLDEPVGLAVDAEGLVYVADTWNRRIQVFTPVGDDGLYFTPFALWDISGWYGDSLDNKPFLAVDDRGNLFVTDPELGRVLQFTVDGTFVRGWGESGLGLEQIGIAAAVAADAEGRIWITDAGNQRILRFTLP